MKLTLEHVNPYLPFGLKIKTELGILELDQISTNSDWNFWCNTKGDYEHKDFNFDNLSKATCSGRGFKGDEIKPILRPLSDYRDTNSKEMNDLNFDIGTQIELMEFANKTIGLDWVNYSTAKICFENHIDIFGLIEKGLAINMNDL